MGRGRMTHQLSLSGGPASYSDGGARQVCGSESQLPRGGQRSGVVPLAGMIVMMLLFYSLSGAKQGGSGVYCALSPR